MTNHHLSPSPPAEERVGERRRTHRLTLPLALLLAACPAQQKTEPIARAQPQPLEPLERVRPDAGGADDDPISAIVPFTPVGPAIPENLTRLTLTGDKLPPLPPQGGVLLVPSEDTYLVQVADLLEQLDDQHREVWLLHPDAPIAFKLTLRDAPHFQEWIDEPVPGKVRVIHRADGFELKTNLGKLPGGDPNGPTVPVRGGRMDLTTLQRGFTKIQARFKSAPDVCFVPSFGMELQNIARALSVNYAKADLPYFGELCLIYPRPPKPDAGAAK